MKNTDVMDAYQDRDDEEESLELSVHEYNNILLEIREQPSWRRNADVEDDYYDGKQLDSETLQMMKDIGMAPIIENIAAPTIDAVLGLEAKTRRDWRVTAENNEQFSEVAEAMNQKLNEAEKHTRADRAVSDAFAGEVKVGVDWVEVGREQDPFKYPYRVAHIHRNEMFWDFKDRTPGLEHAMWLMRSKWYDVRPLTLAFKKHKDLLEKCANGFDFFNDLDFEGGSTTGLGIDFDHDTALSIHDEEWRNMYRKRLRLNELWYRRYVTGQVLKLPDGRVVEYDKSNRNHVEAVKNGFIQPQEAMFSKIRLSFWVGQFKLLDIANPFKHGKFPYVPFWGKRESMTGVPYGLMRPIKPLQDEVNARNTKIHWLLTAKRIIMTEGASVDDEEIVRQEAGRPDAMHILNHEKMRDGGVFRVETDFGLNQQQYQALVDKRQAIKNVAGVYSAFEGSSQDMSGVAINTLAEQSSQTLAEMYDNLAYARSLVGELLLDLIIEDIGNQQHEVRFKKEFENEKVIVLNQPAGFDPISGKQMLNNDLMRAKLKVALSDVPTTASYRAQRLQTLTQITQSLPEQMQGLILDFVIAATDEPNREEIVDRIRKANGFANNKQPKNEQEAQQMEAEKQAMAQAQKMQQEMAMLEIEERKAKVQKTIAEAAKIAAEANGGDNGKGEQLKAQFDEEVQRMEAEFAEAKRMFDTSMTEIEQRHATAIEEANIRADAMIRVAMINSGNKERLKMIEEQAKAMSTAEEREYNEAHKDDQSDKDKD